MFRRQHSSPDLPAFPYSRAPYRPLPPSRGTRGGENPYPNHYPNPRSFIRNRDSIRSPFHRFSNPGPRDRDEILLNHIAYERAVSQSGHGDTLASLRTLKSLQGQFSAICVPESSAGIQLRRQSFSAQRYPYGSPTRHSTVSTVSSGADSDLTVSDVSLEHCRIRGDRTRLEREGAGYRRTSGKGSGACGEPGRGEMVLLAPLSSSEGGGEGGEEGGKDGGKREKEERREEGKHLIFFRSLGFPFSFFHSLLFSFLFISIYSRHSHLYS